MQSDNCFAPVAASQDGRQTARIRIYPQSPQAELPPVDWTAAGVAYSTGFFR